MASIDTLIRIAGGPAAVQTVIDVGANDGADSLPYARRYPAISFVAIEPTPELASQLRSESECLDNYTVVECAIGRADGEALFNVRRTSVLNSLEAVDEVSVGLTGVPPEIFEVLDRVPVRVRTLESLCAELQVEGIDVLHIDAQGSDMDVLISSGRLLQTIRAGVVEVGLRWRLYSNSVGRGMFIRFLLANGLEVVRIEPNDPGNYEQNVFFRQGGLRQLAVARTLVSVARVDLAYALRRLRARAAVRTRLRRAIRGLSNR